MVTLFHSGEVHSALGNTVRFTITAKAGQQKNLIFLIRHIHSSQPKMHLIFVHCANGWEPVKSYISWLGASEIIHFLSFLIIKSIKNLDISQPKVKVIWTL